METSHQGLRRDVFNVVLTRSVRVVERVSLHSGPSAERSGLFGPACKGTAEAVPLRITVRCRIEGYGNFS
jgi:hypothetical protein